MATVPGKRTIGDPDLRDRLCELLEHDHLPHSVGSRCAPRPSSPARYWCGAAMPRPRFILSPRARSKSSCQASVRLSYGTFFGEVALLRRTKRSGTVTATRKTKLLALDAQDFQALIERLPALAAHVKEVADARLADIAQLLKGDIADVEIALAERD